MKALSPREVEVLCWIYYGKGNKDIALILGISALTVKNHVQKLLRKLDIEDRTRAVTLALEQGVIPMKPKEAK